MRNLKAAVCQAAFTDDKSANRAKAESLVRRAAETGATLIVLPEMACWWGALSQMPENGESLDGAWMTLMRRLADELSVYLVAGSFPRIPDGENHDPMTVGRVYNTAPIIGSDGSVLGLADKCHLFDVAVPGGPIVNESDAQIPGESACRLDTPVAELGVAVCYDIRFPEYFRLMIDGGMEIIALPAAFHAQTGRAHWEPLIRARAIENQCYVLAADQCGIAPHGYVSYGHSLVVDPWGRILAQAGDEEAVLAVELSEKTLADVRLHLPALKHIKNNCKI